MRSLHEESEDGGDSVRLFTRALISKSTERILIKFLIRGFK
jgi:hypothetical protein